MSIHANRPERDRITVASTYSLLSTQTHSVDSLCFIQCRSTGQNQPLLPLHARPTSETSASFQPLSPQCTSCTRLKSSSTEQEGRTTLRRPLQTPAAAKFECQLHHFPANWPLGPVEHQALTLWQTATGQGKAVERQPRSRVLETNQKSSASSSGITCLQHLPSEKCSW